MQLYCSLILIFFRTNVEYKGVHSTTMKYLDCIQRKSHEIILFILRSENHYVITIEKQYQMVSLTGAVASNKVSEVFKGTFLLVRN